MFIRNAWYVAGLSEEFGQTLRAIKILNEEIVIYRITNGNPVALEDACPHRKLPLSMGVLEGDHVVCGYHGLTFDCSGKCVRAPTQKNAIPSRAVVNSYPVVDRWNFLWIWIGDPEMANPDDIYNIENFENPAWGMTPFGSMNIACNYLYIMDNLLDPSHVAWVHRTSFAGTGTENQPLEIDVLNDGVIVWRWMMDRPPPSYYADLVSFEGNCDRKQHYECRLPSLAINKSIFTLVGTGGPDKDLPKQAFVNISYNFMTPVDEDNSRYFWFQHRNQHPDNQEISQKMFEGAMMAFEEDREILERVHRGMKKSQGSKLNLGIDAGAIRFRKLLERRIGEDQT